MSTIDLVQVHGQQSVDMLTPEEQAIVAQLPADDAAIEQLEAGMLAADTTCNDRTTHFFTEGLYTRAGEYPAGSVIIGHRHRRQTLNILLKGKIIVRVEGGYRRLQAPFIMNSSPGTRKVAYVVEDVVWVNVHPTDETDLGLLEDLFVEKSPAFLAFEQRKAAS